MPRYLQTLSWIALATSAISMAVILFGPQEGLETLGGGLLAYFALLFHIAIGPVYIVHWYRFRRFTVGFTFFSLYLVIVYSAGFYVFVKTNDIDEAVLDRIESVTNPQDHRLRELGKQLYFQYKFEGPVSADNLAEWKLVAAEASDVNKKDSERSPGLWYAAAIGDEDVVRILLSRGAKTDDANLYYKTPLAAAIEDGHLEIAKLLLAAGANPDEGENKHYPSVSLAVKTGNLEMVDLLIEAGANVNLGDPAPFSIALRAGRVDMVSSLLDAGAEAKMAYRGLPLEVAFENDDKDMVSLLMARSDGFEARTPSKDPLLFDLLISCDIDTFKRYLDMGANPNVVNNRGLSILSRVVLLNYKGCAFEDVRTDFASALIGAGADIDELNDRGESILLRALRQNRPEIARLLVAADASIDGEISGKNFVMLAAGLGLNDLIEKGMDAGFDVSRWGEGMNRSNALHEAARAGHVDTLKFLISHGEKLPADNTNRSNLFRFAAEHPDALELLLELYMEEERTRRSDTLIKSRVRDSKNETSISLLERFGIR